MSPADRPSATAAPASDGPLRQVISRRLLLLFVIGDVLGAGIYALIGEIGGRVGGAIWGAFIAALVLAVLTAFAYAELVTKYPKAAGAALYANKAFKRPLVTFVVAFAVRCSGIASAATLSRRSRRTPWVAILFTTGLAMILAATGDLSDLADTTVLLMLLVFAVVNVAVLVLRRDPVDHDHFHAPSIFPVLGGIACIVLAFDKEGAIWARAGLLLAFGLGLWALNWLTHGRHQPAYDTETLEAVARPG
jgi:amino acid transporter